MTEPAGALEQLKLLEERKELLSKYLTAVNNKIFDLETLYFDECPLGNIVRGWDPDGRVPIQYKNNGRNNIDDKERLFSFSSYAFWSSKRKLEETTTDEVKTSEATSTKPHQSAQKGRKQKKRKSEYDDWINLEDY